VILVSHDRFFLDAVVTRIADLTLRTLTDYVGNYSEYLVAHEARIEQLRKAKYEQDEEVARVRLFIDRFRYQATKASQVQSRIKMLEKVVPIEVPPERKKIHFNFPSCAKSGRTVLELKGARKAYGNLVVLNGLDLHIERGDRIALGRAERGGQVHVDAPAVGRGSPRLTGSVSRATTVVMPVFRPGRGDADGSQADRVRNAGIGLAPSHGARHSEHPRRGSCFQGDDVRKPVRVLSGGERHPPRGGPDAPAARRIRCCSTSRRTISTSTRRKCCSTHSWITAARSSSSRTIGISSSVWPRRSSRSGTGTAVVYPGTYAEFRWHKEHPLGQQEKQEKPQARDSRGGRDQEAGTRSAARQVPREVSKAGGPANRNARGKHDLEGPQESSSRTGDADANHGPRNPDCRHGSRHPRHRKRDGRSRVL
jgi:ATP-binding cassette subfamily F protein 3